MKKIIFTYIFLMTLILPSCLDVDPTGKYGDDDVWASIRNLDYNVKSFYYSTLYNGYVSEIASPGNLSDGYSDLLKYTRYQDGNTANRLFSVVNYLNAENSLSPWSTWYNNIAKLNDFFVAVNAGNGTHLDQDELKIRTAEVRFLRAFTYQDLVIRHGGVVLRIDEYELDGPNDAHKARSSASESWDFIIAEYEKAAADLPEKWDDENGRITKGAAWGMMARAALYAERWDVAISAAEEVEKLAAAGTYALASDYSTVFSDSKSLELILPVFYSLDNGHAFDQSACPSGDQTVFGTVYIGGLVSPTDEFASSFDIKIGSSWESFDWDKVNDGEIADPWENRDPRFYQSILYNGANWRGRTLELYVNGTDGFLQYAESGNEAMRQSVTGYAIRKFLSTDVNYQSVTKSKEYWIEMRYAEILLIMSEAYAWKNDFSKAYSYLNMTRARAGVDGYSEKSSWDDYLDDLQKERICELGLEGHRFWDIRRWGISSAVLDGARTHGVKISKSNDTFTYERVESDVADRYFPQKYNVFPIPSDEIKRNTLCIQDEIWR